MASKQKKTPRRPLPKGRGGLPALPLESVGRALSKHLASGNNKNVMIPNASMIYGVASAALFAFAFYHLMVGQGVFAFLLGVLGALMFAYAVYFIRATAKEADKRGRK